MNKKIKYVVVGIFYNNGKILLSYNNKKNEWCFPAGKVEQNEKIEQALLREMKEELNINITSYISGNVFIYYKNNFYYKLIFHIINDYEGEIINNEPDKCKELYWATLNELKKDDRFKGFMIQSMLPYLNI